MSSLYNTKLFFRSPDTDTAQWISKMIGEHEILENSEGISFGAHQMRDGVSINEHKKQKAIIPYSEFLNLKDLEAYVKLPEDYPVAKVAFNYKDFGSKNSAFIAISEEAETTAEDEGNEPQDEREKPVGEEDMILDLLKLENNKELIKRSLSRL